MFFEPSGEVGFGEFARGQIHHHRVGLFFVSNNLPSILLEEDVHQYEGDSFVSKDIIPFVGVWKVAYIFGKGFENFRRTD